MRWVTHESFFTGTKYCMWMTQANLIHVYVPHGPPSLIGVPRLVHLFIHGFTLSLLLSWSSDIELFCLLVLMLPLVCIPGHERFNIQDPMSPPMSGRATSCINLHSV